MGLLPVFSSLLFLNVCVAVVILKCCPEGLELRDKQCVKSSRNNSISWVPSIYSPIKRAFLPPGTLPDGIEFSISFPTKCNKTRFSNSKFAFLENGTFMSFMSSLPPDEVCVAPNGYHKCYHNEEQLIKKCCGTGAAFSEKSGVCQHTEYRHPFFRNLTQRLLTGFPSCSEVKFISAPFKENKHNIHDDGTLKGLGKPISGDHYCLEFFIENPEDSVHIFTCPDHSFNEEVHNDIRLSVYPVGLLISVIFLAITLVASCLLPSTYHVLHWRCQTNHVACLLIGDFLLAITQLSGNSLKGPACVSIAVAMHFMFLAAFFWLNTMCFNIWWTFRDLRPAILDRGQEACRLRLYEVYAWGGPLIIATLGAVMDNLPEPSYPSFLRPRFGEQRCWFRGDAEMLAYFYGPIGVLLFLNLTLFAATARELTCGLWRTEMVKSNTERATLGRVCLKLVVVMGITWVADVVSWVVGGPTYLWYLTDIINTLQGVLIFAVVGCQPQIWAAVKRLWCLSRDSPSENGNVRSSSSHGLPSVGDHNISINKPTETSLC